MHKFKIEATKFTVVGAANFALTFFVFTTMLKVLAMNYLLSLVAAWLVGMLFSYVLNFSWVFKPEQKIQFRAQFVRFFLASLFSIALNLVVLKYLVDRTDFDPFYVQIVLIPFIVVFNFLTAKFWSFKPGNIKHLMINKFNSMGITNGQLCIVFFLFFMAVIWRCNSLMPNVFYGDDLGYLLDFKDGKCGTIASQLLTTACYDKYRPVAAGIILLTVHLFDLSITHYMVFNVFLLAISAIIVFTISYRLSKGSLITAFSIGIAVATSRFSVYQVTQVIGPVEGFALPIFLGVIYAVIRVDERQDNASRWSWIAIFLSFVLIHNHERYILIFAWLCTVFLLLPNVRILPKKNFLALLVACLLMPLFYISYKAIVLHSPFLVGTGGTHLNFDIWRVIAHLRQAILSIFGFNEGPEYLVGIRLISLPWYPAWFFMTIFIITAFSSVYFGVRNALFNKYGWVSILLSVRWLVLLVSLLILLIIPAISTIRLEQRWLFPPFILILLIVSWAVGQKKDKQKFPVWLPPLIISAASILLDTIIVKHFNEVFFVSEARFAEIVKRDVVDKIPRQLSAINFLAAPSHCNWALQHGGFFRIYGGQALEIKCISLKDITDEKKLNENTRFFIESPLKQITDVTSLVHSRIQTKRGRIIFDFINEFESGNINSNLRVSTPTNKGVFVQSSDSLLERENAIILLPGFSYRFNEVLIEQGSQLRFGLSMIYDAEPIESVVYIIEKDEANKKIIFSKIVQPPRSGNKLMFTSEKIPLSAYVGRRISVIFSAKATSKNLTGQWLGYSEPQIYVDSGESN